MQVVGKGKLRVGVDIALAGPAALDVAIGRASVVLRGIELLRRVTPEDAVGSRQAGSMSVDAAANAGRVPGERAVGERRAAVRAADGAAA